MAKNSRFNIKDFERGRDGSDRIRLGSLGVRFGIRAADQGKLPTPPVERKRE